MFFSTDIRQVDVVESPRSKSSNNDIISCAKTLQSYIKVEESICHANDVATCQSNLVVPDPWDVFMKRLC